MNNFGNDSNFNANDRNVDNHNHLRGIAKHSLRLLLMQYRNLWQELCSYQNLKLAYKKARKRKTQKNYVIKFEKDLQNNLFLLRSELFFHYYQPKPLTHFTINDPKTRKISKSHFRDRVIHHALCNIIEPIFENTFICDSYANRKNKGTLKAVQRFNQFKRKVSRNNTKKCFILKADIKKYFENVNHQILINIIKKQIKDKKVLWLIQNIIGSISRERESESAESQGLPLGNLTSQFFANVYLNELDQFIKHKLKIKCYIRYVDDFVILHNSKNTLKNYKIKINQFLKTRLNLQLHPQKSKILKSNQGIDFLGFRIFPHHKLLRKRNFKTFKRKFQSLQKQFNINSINYDQIYDFLEGWIAYAKQSNTYKLRKKITSEIEKRFPNKISTKETNRISKYDFSC